jgi:hypothetical protein
VLLGLVLSRFFGWGGAIAAIAAVLLLLLAQWLLRWWADVTTDDYTAQVTTFAPWNNDLTLYIHKTAHLHGARCEVERSCDPGVVRSAEYLRELYGGSLLGPQRVTFPYPSAFTPSDRSTPDPGEACMARWYVRATRGGEWLFAAENQFRFGLSGADALAPTTSWLGDRGGG